jgi:hypothetical protein
MAVLAGDGLCDGYNGVAKNYSKFVPSGGGLKFRSNAATYRRWRFAALTLSRIKTLRDAQILCDAR